RNFLQWRHPFFGADSERGVFDRREIWFSGDDSFAEHFSVAFGGFKTFERLFYGRVDLIQIAARPRAESRNKLSSESFAQTFLQEKRIIGTPQCAANAIG